MAHEKIKMDKLQECYQQIGTKTPKHLEDILEKILLLV